MIIVIGGIKGGSGKTTIATNLAVLRARAGRDVLLIDADDQESSYTFTQVRNSQCDAGFGCILLTGQAVGRETLRLAHKYQDIVIDSGGRDTTSQRAALTVADLAIVPFKPRSLDVWTLGRVNEMIEAATAVNSDLKAVSFLNMADSRGQDNDEASEILREAVTLQLAPVSIGNRKAFANAAAAGKSVLEMRPSDPKACEEIRAAYEYVFDTKLVSTELIPLGGER